MAFFDIGQLKGKTVSVIGTVKNAGKTTALNALIDELPEDFTIGLTSVGRDGEKTDIVTFTDKPEVYVKKGTLVATASKLLARSGFTKEIIRSTGFSTPVGDVYMARALSAGYAQIGGPSTVTQLGKVRDMFFEEGADAVLIDGAAGRRSLGAAQVADGVVLCTGAGFSRDMEETAEYAAFIAGFFALPTESECEEEIKRIYVSGAVLDSTLEELTASLNAEKSPCMVVFDDPSKLMFSEKNWKRLLRYDIKPALKEKPELLAIAINPVSPYGWRYDAESFKSRLCEMTDVPVYDFGKESR